MYKHAPSPLYIQVVSQGFHLAIVSIFGVHVFNLTLSKP